MTTRDIVTESGLETETSAFNDDYPLFDNTAPERAAELFRLALAELKRFGAPPIPLSYALCYFYAAGTDVALREKMDALLNDGGGWQFDQARDLFLRHLTPCNDTSMAELQQELLALVNSIAASALNANQSATNHSEALDRHIHGLEGCQDLKRALQIAAQIVQEARQLAENSKLLASDMQEAATEVDKLREELVRARREASLDALTGLNNRRAFDAKLRDLVAIDKPFSLIMMDIDHFKLINDEHGHPIGDRVLQQLAKKMLAQTRTTDVVSRYGGEEFAVLLPLTSLSEARKLADKMRVGIGMLNMRRTDKGTSLGRITSSFGVAEYRRGESIDQLVARADNALYAAKKKGRDRVEAAAPTAI
jgi:diguanylate cyclase